MLETYSIGVKFEVGGNVVSGVEKMMKALSEFNRAVGISQEKLENLGGAGSKGTAKAQEGFTLAERQLAEHYNRDIDIRTKAAEKIATQTATAQRQEAEYLNKDMDIRSRDERALAEHYNRDIDIRTKAAEKIATQTATAQRQEAEYLNKDMDIRSRDERALAEHYNRDLDLRTKAAERIATQTATAQRQEAEYLNKDFDMRKKAADRVIEQAKVSHADYMMIGMGLGMAGGAMTGAAGSVISHAIEPEHLRTQLLSDTRVSPAQADAAQDRAYEATRLAPGSRVAENMATLIDIKNITGSLDEAMEFLPKVAQLTTLLQVIDQKQGKAGHGGDQGYAALKAMEILGEMVTEKTDATGHTTRSIDFEKGQAVLDKMGRIAVAMNNRVDPKQLLAFAKTGAIPGMLLSEEFTFEKLPAMIATMGGSKVGTMLQSISQVFDGGRMTNKSMDALEEIGLAGKGTYTTKYDPESGKNKRVRTGGGVLDLDMLRHDPLEWMQKAQDRMEKAGIHGTEAQIVALQRASQRSTIARFLGELLKDAPAILKEQQNIKNTVKNPFEFFAANDPVAKMQQLSAAFDKLSTSLGSGALSDAMRAVDSVTAALNGLGDWAKNNPTMSRLLVDAGAGLGAVAVGLGALTTAIFVFGPALTLLGKLSPGGVPPITPGTMPSITPGGVPMTLGKGLVTGLRNGLVLGAGEVVGELAITAGMNAAEDAIFGKAQGAINRFRYAQIKNLEDQRPGIFSLPFSGGFQKNMDIDKQEADLRKSWATPAANSNGSAANINVQGTVNLDGKKVGTWLGQQVGNTTSGATGFDPRMTPMPTGATP